ncbi:MAG: YfiR family protein [Gammaproteobacteria bacterium]
MAVLTAAIARARHVLLRLPLLLVASLSIGASSGLAEYQVKAVFLFNFTQFVEWPPEAFADAQSPFVIGVLGRDPFGKALDDAVRGEKVNGHSLVVQRYDRVSDLKPCQILFIDQSARTEAGKAIEALGHQRTLTVSDFEADAAREVIIRFLNEDKKIRLRINVDSARDAGLVISSKLLRPSQVVGSTGTG